jgi:hypothetical protein
VESFFKRRFCFHGIGLVTSPIVNKGVGIQNTRAVSNTKSGAFAERSTEEGQGKLRSLQRGKQNGLEAGGNQCLQG